MAGKRQSSNNGNGFEFIFVMMEVKTEKCGNNKHETLCNGYDTRKGQLFGGAGGSTRTFRGSGGGGHKRLPKLSERFKILFQPRIVLL